MEYKGDETKDAVNVWKNKAKALIKEGEFDQAVEYYNRVLEVEEGDEKILESKGNLLRKLGRLKEALECYNRITILGYFLGALVAACVFIPAGIFLTIWGVGKSSLIFLLTQLFGLSSIISGIVFALLCVYVGSHRLVIKRNLQKQLREDKR